MDCWIVIGRANYKILAADPIPLPWHCAFSTPSAAGHVTRAIILSAMLNA
jgi:hypothetical protein